MNNPWSVDDGFGNTITSGLQEHVAGRVAQEIADRLNRTVYLYEQGDETMLTITPSDPVQTDEPNGSNADEP